MRRRLHVLAPLLILAALLLGACGGGESDSPAAAGGLRLRVASPRDAALQAVSRIYGGALEKAGVTVIYVEPADADVQFDAVYKGAVLDAVTARVGPDAVPALEAEVEKIHRALSSEELTEIQEETDPKDEDHISPEAAAARWMGLNGF